MPIEIALWRMGEELCRIGFSPIDTENRLEQMLVGDITIVDSSLLLIGRRVPTSYGKFIDLLALDADGNLVVMELKRNRTPREVVAQLLDYGSWVRDLEDDDKDEDREYLSRAWLNAPGDVEAKVEEKRVKLPWNGEYYVSFGHHEDCRGRHWEDARKHGFVSAGGGEWYVRTLNVLEPGARIWVNIPGRGYVGVGTVAEGPVIVDDFRVHLVRVDWLKTVPVAEAVREKGFFGNQNSAAKPRAKRWIHTVERLKTRFGITD